MTAMKSIVCMLTLFLLATTVQYAWSEPVVNCHCFRNRTFNPDDRFAADDYLLTTVFNSLTAGYFGVEKRRIVMLKMKGGAQNDELLIALYIERHTQTDVEELMDMKKNKTWQQVLEEIPIDESFGKDKVYKLLIEGASETQAAGQITATMLSGMFGIPAENLDEMIEQKFSWRQLSLALILADYTGTDMQSIIALQRKQQLSWSEIAHNFGLEPEQAGKIAENPSRKKQ